jgi:GNAT superfamily N-acetyltransferase
MNKVLAIRVATAADVPALFDIRTSVRENHQSMEGLREVGVTPESIAHMLQTTSRAWIADIDCRPVAFTMANAAERTVFAMFVRPGYEGRGLGRALMAETEAWLFAGGADEIWLTTGADPGIRANGFYQHLGWRATGLTEGGEIRYVKRRLLPG